MLTCPVNGLHKGHVSSVLRPIEGLLIAELYEQILTFIYRPADPRMFDQTRPCLSPIPRTKYTNLTFLPAGLAVKVRTWFVQFITFGLNSDYAKGTNYVTKRNLEHLL